MDKERKIAFYTLVKDMWANNADGLEGLIPFYEMYLQPIITQYFASNKSEIWP